MRRGRCVGSEPFRAEMFQHIEQQRGKWHYGAEFAESGKAKAERLVAEAGARPALPKSNEPSYGGRRTVDWSGQSCEAPFWDWKLGPAKSHYL